MRTGGLIPPVFFNKKKQIIELQDSYAKAMSPFGLERGLSKEETGAIHQTLNEWRKEECERLEKELAELVDNVLANERDTHTAGALESELFDELQ